MSNSHSDNPGRHGNATLSPPYLPPNPNEQAGRDLLGIVDDGSSVTTATALNRNIRSRSRSPHPAHTTSPSAQIQDSKQESSPRFDREADTQDPSADLHYHLSGPSNGSDVDLSTSSGTNKPPAAKLECSNMSMKSRITAQWEASKGLFMVAVAMLFTALMGATARLMETGPNPMHTFQIIFARMSITALLSMAYMKWKKIPDAPLGPRGVRKILVARGVGGFFGMFGLYYSVKYLPLGEATVITFIAPMVANGVCSVLLKESFSRREQLAGVISLIGVVFIARPTSFFASPDDHGSSNAVVTANSTMAETKGPVSNIPEATPAQRLTAVLASLLGVCGAASAYTTIRWIGKRAHPLISVNYFSVWCTIVSLVVLAVAPDVSFRFPADFREWVLLISLGTFGMIMQFLLTAGLARQKGSAATNVTYIQMIFVMIIDYAIWGVVLMWSSWVGCVLILGSQIWAAMARSKVPKEGGDEVRERERPRQSTDEEAGLVEGMDLGEEGEDEDVDETHLEMTEMRPPQKGSAIDDPE